jgi:Kef-type K+ transport system membrane component KefB
LDVPTRSSNRPAGLAVLAGIAAVLALPAAIALAQVSSVRLLQASTAIPVAAVLAVAALWLARRAAQRVHRSFGRSGGAGAARLGRFLGVLGLCLAASATISVAFYELLVHYQ